MGQVRKPRPKSTVVTLKMVAQHVGLTPGTVSAVLNDAPSARSIPQKTKNRIHAAAKELEYRPNFFAQSLRNKRTYMIGVIAEEIGDSYGSLVISGIEEYLREKDYFFLTVVHRHDPELLKRYSQLLMQRGVEGFITVDMQLTGALSLPTVAVPGHENFPGVTNIVLDHQHAARVALTHLVQLGHRNIAFMKGQSFSSDSEHRWGAICQVAEELKIKIRPELCVQIDIDDPTPQLGYPFAKQLLDRKVPFTALFAYNDISALGAIRAFQEAGRRVPQDISVVGFDDIQGAAYSIPTLTTVRQPLADMGRLAARTLLARIEGAKDSPGEIPIEPVLVVRQSTAQAPASPDI
ncbi:MAG TPA: LacI family DNA-binding transcriptional regulator [Candidatus Sulfotelmatobacter sp.]|jgi:DNA-binding LacI/PurR family transcriptional regulator|nr:LacI family DNA-binding transcriptional regulator [Candidatus Sulfotelmatobacter sp.]